MDCVVISVGEVIGKVVGDALGVFVEVLGDALGIFVEVLGEMLGVVDGAALSGMGSAGGCGQSKTRAQNGASIGSYAKVSAIEKLAYQILLSKFYLLQNSRCVDQMVHLQ